MATIANLQVKIGSDISGLKSGLQETRNSLQKTGQEFKNIGGTLTTGVTLPLAAAGGAALKFATDLNAGMANVATLIPGNTQRVIELKKSVQDMAIATGKSTSDISGGLYQVISAFGDTSDTVKILEANVKSARAGLASTTDAINLTSAVTKGYGDTTAEAVRKASDLAFITVKLGQTSFPELAASIGRTVPLAAQLKVEQEELFAGFATLTGVTGETAEVSTQLAAILRAMIKPTTDMSAAIESLGYSGANAMVEQLGMVGALRELMKTTDGTEESVAKLFGRAEALTAVFALTSTQAETFDNKLGELYEALGATEEAYREQTEGVNKLGFEYERAKQKAAVYAQTAGDALAPAIIDVIDAAEPLIDTLKNALEWFTNLEEGTQRTILKTVAFTMALGPLMFGIGQTMHVMQALLGVVQLLTPAIATSAGATAVATGATTGLSIASFALAGKIALVTGAVWLLYEAIKDSKKGQDSLGASSGILGYNMQNLQRDIDNVNQSLREQTDETNNLTLATLRKVNAVQNYTDTIEANRLGTVQQMNAVQSYTDTIEANRLKTHELTELEKERKKLEEEIKKAIDDTTGSVNQSTGAMVANAASMKNATDEAKELEKQMKLVYNAYRKIDSAPSNIVSKYMADYINRTGDMGVAFGDAPQFDSGGVVPGPIGAPVPIIAHGGETVLPTHKSGGGSMTIVVQMDGREVTRAMLPYMPGELARVGVR